MSAVKRWQFWIGVLVSIVFLWLALRGLKLADMLAVLPNVNFCGSTGIAIISWVCKRLALALPAAPLEEPSPRAACSRLW
jgi:uncharacterized membrane protein (DUF441 family)